MLFLFFSLIACKPEVVVENKAIKKIPSFLEEMSEKDRLILQKSVQMIKSDFKELSDKVSLSKLKGYKSLNSRVGRENTLMFSFENYGTTFIASLRNDRRVSYRKLSSPMHWKIILGMMDEEEIKDIDIELNTDKNIQLFNRTVVNLNSDSESTRIDAERTLLKLLKKVFFVSCVLKEAPFYNCISKEAMDTLIELPEHFMAILEYIKKLCQNIEKYYEKDANYNSYSKKALAGFVSSESNILESINRKISETKLEKDKAILKKIINMLIGLPKISSSRNIKTYKRACIRTQDFLQTHDINGLDSRLIIKRIEKNLNILSDSHEFICDIKTHIDRKDYVSADNEIRKLQRKKALKSSMLIHNGMDLLSYIYKEVKESSEEQHKRNMIAFLKAISPESWQIMLNHLELQIEKERRADTKRLSSANIKAEVYVLGDFKWLEEGEESTELKLKSIFSALKNYLGAEFGFIRRKNTTTIVASIKVTRPLIAMIRSMKKDSEFKQFVLGEVIGNRVIKGLKVSELRGEVASRLEKLCELEEIR